MRIPRRSLLLVTVLAACGDPAPPRVPPPLPGPGLVEPNVRRVLEEARGRVVSAPDDVDAWRTFAAAVDANGLEEAAEPAWRAVVALAPDDPRARLHLARALRALGRDDEAMDSLRTAEELAPEVAALRVRRGAWQLDAGRVEEATAAFEEARRLDPSASGPVIGLARAALDRGDPATARAHLDDLVAAGGRDPYAAFLLAEAARRLGDDETATLARSLADPARRSAWLVCAWEREVLAARAGFDHRKSALLSRLGREPPESLLEPLAALHAERPDDLGLLAARVEALLATGAAARATRLLDEADEALPGHPRVALLRSRLLHAVKDLPGAIAAAADAVERQPDLGLGHLQLGLLRAEAGASAAARADLEEALRLGVEDGTLFMNLALLQRRLGDEDDAVRTLETAGARRPAFLPAWLLLAELRLRRGEVADARRALARAERLAPEDPRVRSLARRLPAPEDG
ncbi:MAG: tetratricopeptide repeat protein [Planctomycetota bacterium JB042]